MKWLGKLVSAPVKIVNAPVRALERMVDPDDSDDSKILSRPLEILADEIEKAAGGTP